MKVKLEITVPKIQMKIAKAQDLTGASRMVLGSSGVHKDPDNESNINRPSGSDGARGGRSDDHSMPSGRSFGEDGRI